MEKVRGMYKRMTENDVVNRRPCQKEASPSALSSVIAMISTTKFEQVSNC